MYKDCWGANWIKGLAGSMWFLEFVGLVRSKWLLGIVGLVGLVMVFVSLAFKSVWLRRLFGFAPFNVYVKGILMKHY